MTARRDLTGRRFGKLVAVAPTSSQKQRVMWLCNCDCGATTTVRGSALTTGNSTSCGCGVREAMARTGSKNRTHGKSRTGEYYSWRAMITRCTSPESNRFKYYGARGIRVCDQWLSSFETFLADMGPRPTPQHTIDRINNDGNYEPSNCRWATLLEQRHNRRPNPSRKRAA